LFKINQEEDMPISRKEFLKGFGSSEPAVINFLEQNQDNAYMISEIIVAIGPKSLGTNALENILLGSEIAVSYLNMLNALVDKGWVKRNYIDGAYWYAFRNKAVTEI
jgi:hypothetical protein